MFTYFVVSLIAVLAFGIFEYLQNKATYSFKTAWFKYVAAILLGTFGFSYLLNFRPFEYILVACFVVSFLYFFWVIIKWLKIKGLPGQK